MMVRRAVRQVVVTTLALGFAFLGTQAATFPPDRTDVIVRGTFFNQKQNPMTEAEITLRSLDGQTFTAYTDASGAFDLGVVPPGVYSVSVKLEKLEQAPGEPKVEVLQDGTLQPPLAEILLRNRGPGSPGMWGEVLLFLGLAAGGGVAVF